MAAAAKTVVLATFAIQSGNCLLGHPLEEQSTSYLAKQITQQQLD
jgi:hypothetical protein